MNPIEAKTEKQICQLARSSFATTDWWLNVSHDHVCLTKQRMGSLPQESLRIPRRDFDKLAQWYVTGK